VLGDDDDVRPAHGQARILRGGLLVASGDHKTHVDAFGACHAVAADGLVEGVRQLRARHPDVEAYRLGTLEEPVEVKIEEGELAVVQPEALPHAVPDEKAGVEDGDLRLLPRVELAVDVDEYVLVAPVRQGRVRSPSHPFSSHRSIPRGAPP
jgi:hypothetical protein